MQAAPLLRITSFKRYKKIFYDTKPKFQVYKIQID